MAMRSSPSMVPLTSWLASCGLVVAATLGACQPPGATPSAPVPPTAATASEEPSAYPPPGLPTATATPEVGRDANGYRPAPPTDGDSRLQWADYVPLEVGEDGPFLVRLQDLLTSGDPEGLVALMGPGPAGDAFQFAYLEATEGIGNTTRPDMLAALRRLFAAGSRPVIQGYFPGAGDFNEPESSLAVVIDGWQGAFDLPTPEIEEVGMGLPDAPGDTAVWRFERDGDAWRWRGWHYLDGGYGPTVEAFANLFGSDEHPLTYRVVRPRLLFPTPAVEETAEKPSPDGRWVARTVTGKGNVIDPRDERSFRLYRALEVADTTGKVVWRPVESWDGDGFPRTYTQIFAWHPDSQWLLYSTFSVSDGCGGLPSDDLQQIDVTTGISGTLGLAGWGFTLDPSGRRLAWVSKASDNTGEAHVRDLDTGREVTGTLPADVLDLLGWSPDGRTVALSMSFDPSGPCGEMTRSGLALFDTASAKVRTLLPPAPGRVQLDAWTPDGVLVVSTYEVIDFASDDKLLRTVYLDAETGQVRPDITPTAAP